VQVLPVMVGATRMDSWDQVQKNHPRPSIFFIPADDGDIKIGRRRRSQRAMMMMMMMHTG